MHRDGITWLELLIAVACVFMLAILILPALARPHERPRRPSCQNNLKEMALVYRMYASETQGEKYPPVQMRHYEVEGWESQFAFAPEIRTIWPEYLTDQYNLLCPSDSDDDDVFYGKDGDYIFSHPEEGRPFTKAGCSYLYFGWVFDQIGDEKPLVEEALPEPFQGILPEDAPVSRQFHEHWKQLFQEYVIEKDDTGRDEDFTVPAPSGNTGKKTVYRLRNEIEYLLVNDFFDVEGLAAVRSRTFIMLDRMGRTFEESNHVPLGCNVLFLDGHVDFIRFPGKTPCSNALAAGIELFETVMNAETR